MSLDGGRVLATGDGLAQSEQALPMWLPLVWTSLVRLAAADGHLRDIRRGSFLSWIITVRIFLSSQDQVCDHPLEL